MDDLTQAIVRMLAVPISDERPWLVFGACRDADPDLFFPTTAEQSDQALAICASCPVRPECLEYALEAGERFGIWGGTTEKRRRKLATQLRRSA
jgi:WhiB family redox-sensing transcriptional regulator